ncbi:DUF6325 family protein [Microbacterium sp. W1N]|uniref:DUF6325 family protein n=1 Tax=Microbacterium festucae TaxID=2977531 RepID=UPI0021BE3177|nr:DUF6325 family protein [Microbacterium festucae]MCT9819222.1 DUF6325 family protein [Microbacterium festucae]
MTQFTYGPVELYLVGFEGDRPNPQVIRSLTDLLEGGLVRLLDFILISRSDSGEVTVTEIEDETEEYGFGGVELGATGIVADDDVAEFAELIPPGSSAALVALELSWARDLARSVDAAGAVVLRSERIPAPIVNAVVDAVAAAE